LEIIFLVRRHGLRKRLKIFKVLSLILVGLGFGLVIAGVFSIVKYPKKSFPEQPIRVIRAAVGVVIVSMVLLKTRNQDY
jgi:hypothetical protein